MRKPHTFPKICNCLKKKSKPLNPWICRLAVPVPLGMPCSAYRGAFFESSRSCLGIRSDGISQPQLCQGGGGICWYWGLQNRISHQSLKHALWFHEGINKERNGSILWGLGYRWGCLRRCFCRDPTRAHQGIHSVRCSESGSPGWPKWDLIRGWLEFQQVVSMRIRRIRQ